MDTDPPIHSNRDRPIKVAQPMSYVRITVDPDGETHFSDERLDFTLVDYAPPAPPISISQSMVAENVSIISSPPGWYGDWHPAPRRQIMILLSGELEAEVSDGETRRFPSGSMVILEDTHGRGHTSRVLGDERVYMVAIPLREAE